MRIRRWFYGRKRGNRHTGLPWLGRAGETLFFACLLFVGCAGLAHIFSAWIWPEWRANRHFVSTQCLVKAKRLITDEVPDGYRYRPQFFVAYDWNERTHHLWCYDIAGYSTTRKARAREILERFEVGQHYSGWCDPRFPERFVMVRGFSWWLWLLLLLPVPFIAVGLGGLVWAFLTWNRSPEQRLAPRRASAEGTNGERLQPAYPFIPGNVDLTNSPGVRLAYRLPLVRSPARNVIAATVAFLLWNTVLGIIFYLFFSGVLLEQSGWWFGLAVTPLTLIGLFLLYYWLRQILLTGGIGTTRAEISDHPLRPGESYRLFIEQTGRGELNVFAVDLVCEERATYHQGTDVRTEIREIWWTNLFRRTELKVSPNRPCEVELSLRVPRDAMHSFKSEHNEILWKLVVVVHMPGWPKYERSFPLVVYPRSAVAIESTASG